MPTDVLSVCIAPSATVEEAIACIDRSGRISIALVVDAEGRLMNTLTDGDIRRGLLAGVGLADDVGNLLVIKNETPHPVPVTAPPNAEPDELLQLMNARGVRQIPIVTEEGRVVDVVAFDDVSPDYQLPSIRAVVMAGGFGTRLAPLTESVPKPMLPVGGRPLIELVVEQLQEIGVRKIAITTHYRAEQIESHLGDGSSLGVEITYIREDRPLGTGGALGLLAPSSEPVLVINGDVLTDTDFRAMHCYHQKLGATMTVAVRRYAIDIPYGVVESEGSNIRRLREKPQLSFFVNAGMYFLEPEVFEYVVSGQPLRMTDLIETLISEGRKVASFPLREYWLDIGQHADYEKAQIDATSGRLRSRPSKA